MGNEGKYAWRKQRWASTFTYGDYGSNGTYQIAAHMVLYDNIAFTPGGQIISAGSCHETHSGNTTGTELHGYWFLNGEFQGIYFNGTIRSNPDTTWGAPTYICYGARVTASVKTYGYAVGDTESAYPTPPNTIADGEMFYTKITA